jgi:hypothetical protein
MSATSLTASWACAGPAELGIIRSDTSVRSGRPKPKERYPPYSGLIKVLAPLDHRFAPKNRPEAAETGSSSGRPVVVREAVRGLPISANSVRAICRALKKTVTDDKAYSAAVAATFSSRSQILNAANAASNLPHPIASHTSATRADRPETVIGNRAASSKAPFSLMR